MTPRSNCGSIGTNGPSLRRSKDNPRPQRMALLRSPRTDDPFQLSFGLSRYRQCCAACPHATQHSRSDAIVKLCMRHYTRRVFQRPLSDTPTPERCVEAYHLQRTRFEKAAERKLRWRQLTEDGNVEITGRDLREGFPLASW